MKSKNKVTIIVVILAALAIAFVSVLALIPVNNLTEYEDCSTYTIRYGGDTKFSDSNLDTVIESRKTVNRLYESTSMQELIDSCGYSVFKSWMQFEYELWPQLSDYYEAVHSSVGQSTITGLYDGTSELLSGNFSFTFDFDEQKEYSFTDYYGVTYTQTYDTAIVVIEETNGAVGNIMSYVFNYNTLYGNVDNSDATYEEVGYNIFYPVELKLCTTTAIDVLFDIFDIDEVSADADTDTDTDTETE